MYENYKVAGNGMQRMFQGEMIAVIALVVMIIPVLGWIIGPIGILVGGILSLVGLHSAVPAHPNFSNAFNFMIANVVLSFLSGFAGDGALGTLLSLAGSVLGFLVTYFVCIAAAELLSDKGDNEQAERGQFIWKLYLGCAVVAVVCGILAMIPVIGALAAIVLVIAAIVELVASILYLIFLYKASQSLLS